MLLLLLVHFPLTVIVVIVSPETLSFLSFLPPTPSFSLYCRLIFNSIVMAVVVVIVTDVDAVVTIVNDSGDHKRDTMNEDGERVIINTKYFIVIMLIIMIFKIKMKHDKGVTRKGLITLSQDIIHRIIHLLLTWKKK